MDIPEFEYLVTTFDAPTASLTVEINRPEVLNAFNNATKHEISGALGWARSASEVKSVILVGAGDRAFSAGADLKDPESDHSPKDFGEFAAWREGVEEFTSALAEFPKVLISAVNGYAVGGGMGLALSADIVIGTPTCEFRPHINVGLIPGSKLMHTVAASIGERRMWYYALTGQSIRAQQAYEWGLLVDLVDLANLRQRALEIAGMVAPQSSLAIAMMKESYRLADGMSRQQSGVADGLRLFGLTHSPETQSRHSAVKAAW